MNASDAALDQALSELLKVAGDTISYAGKTYPAVVSSLAMSDEYENGGHIVKRGIHVAMRAKDMNPVIPKIGNLIISGGYTYQIETIDSTAQGYTLNCQQISV